jgi:hypothetical protein
VFAIASAAGDAGVPDAAGGHDDRGRQLTDLERLKQRRSAGDVGRVSADPPALEAGLELVRLDRAHGFLQDDRSRLRRIVDDREWLPPLVVTSLDLAPVLPGDARAQARCTDDSQRRRRFDVEQVEMPEVERVFLTIARHAVERRERCHLEDGRRGRQLRRKRRLDRHDVLVDFRQPVLPAPGEHDHLGDQAGLGIKLQLLCAGARKALELPRGRQRLEGLEITEAGRGKIESVRIGVGADHEIEEPGNDANVFLSFEDDGPAACIGL